MTVPSEAASPAALLSAAQASLLDAAGRLAAVLRELPTATTAVPRSSWTVRDTAAHLVSWAPVYAAIAAGAGSPLRSFDRAEVAAHNARLLADVRAADPAGLADLVAAAGRTVIEATCLPAERLVPFHGGTRQDVAGLAGFALGEMLVHGYDIANAVGAPWKILPDDVALVLRAYAAVIPAVVDADATSRLTAIWEIDLGHAGRFAVRFDGGAFALADPAAVRADCVIEACPQAFLLVITGRLDVWTAITLGNWRGSGPRPGLAPRYPRLFRTV